MPTLREISPRSCRPTQDGKTLRQWFAERDWAAWDREVEEDAKSGRLDFLAEEAEVAGREARLFDL